MKSTVATPCMGTCRRVTKHSLNNKIMAPPEGWGYYVCSVCGKGVMIHTAGAETLPDDLPKTVKEKPKAIH